ncbi:MAG: division/cell wall cluster transcriptional repressor MraZ [Salibacteraceae bacterium]
MAGFIGEYECKLDAKGRFMLPSGLRKQLDPVAQEKFVLNRGFEGCLVLYPQNEWDKISGRLQQLNLFVARNRKFYRQFHNGATQMALDNTGRLNLPNGLMRFASLDKTIVLFAYANRIEVWDKEKYDEVMNEDLGGFADLAEEVMGDFEDEGQGEA